MHWRGASLIHPLVPDLAFNELKFLRESNEHQDEQHLVHDSMRRSNNQDKKRETEREEISAYFDQRNPQHDSAPDRRTTKNSNILVDGETLTDHEDVREGGSSPKLPDGELTANPYLGFGSKGTISKSTHPQPSTTTYLTWSESGNGIPMYGKQEPPFETALEAGELTAPKPTVVRRSKRDIHVISANDHTELPERNRIDVRNRQRATSRRVRVPENINVYTDMGVTEPVSSKEMLRDCKSQSLPVERPRKSTRGQRKRTHAVEHANTLSSGGESFHTSDILEMRTRLQWLAETRPSEPKSTHAPPHDKENIPPDSSSSPTAKIIRTAHGAMMQQQLEMSVKSPERIRQQNAFDVVELEHPSYPLPYFQHRPEPHLRDPSEVNFERSATRGSAALMGYYTEQRAWQDMHNAYDGVVEPEGEETLDTYAMGELEHQSIENVVEDHRYAGVYSTPGISSNARFLSRQNRRPSTRGQDTPWSRSGIETVCRGTSSHNTLAEQDVLSREDRSLDQEFEDGLEGFWRPNRLY